MMSTLLIIRGKIKAEQVTIKICVDSFLAKDSGVRRLGTPVLVLLLILLLQELTIITLTGIQEIM